MIYPNIVNSYNLKAWHKYKILTMKEELLIHVWRYKLFSNFDFKTVEGLPVEVISYGQINNDSGPDFFNSKIKVDSQLWAGNVEIHVNSSDWIKHNHQFDTAYNNVILHVVFNHDMDIEISGNNLPVLELKNYISQSVIDNYNSLTIPSKSFLHCAKTNSHKNDFEYHNWIESVFIKKLENKLNAIDNQLTISANNWEQVLFRTISRSFGLKLNGDAFANFSSSFDFKILLTQSSDRFDLEALFFGQSGFLESEFDFEDEYFKEMKLKYEFIKNKFSLVPINSSQYKFFRTRPANFPTIRLAQLSSLYSLHPYLFSKIINCKSIDEIKMLFDIEVSSYWKNHYNFEKPSKKFSRNLTSSFVELIMINGIIPIRFAYFKSISDYDKIEETIQFSEELKNEKNTVIDEFVKQGWEVKNAKDSQALLYLKNKYCDTNNCLNCLIGNRILQQN